jgi:hypothetical protein
VHVLDRPARKSGVAFLAIEVAQVCGGEAPQLHVAERGLDVEAGDLFVPLKGVASTDQRCPSLKRNSSRAAKK